MPYDEDGNVITTKIANLTQQIERTARQQHLTGRRREAFTDSVSLCGTCKWAQSRRRAGKNTLRMDCQMFTGPCPEDINECSEYATITSLSLSQMAEIAILIGGQEGKKVGFIKE
jgi:hypothetical protein